MNTGSLQKAMQWLIVAMWLTVPFVTGDILDASVDDRGLRWIVSVGSWALWATTLTAALVRHPITLTTLRLGTSAGATAAIAASLFADSVSTTRSIAGTALPIGCWILSMSPEIGAMYVDGASYGDERRFPLRFPAALLLGPLPIAWIIFIIGGSAGPLLLGSERWIPGGIALVVGLPGAVMAVRAMNGLSRRWVVFVPAGVVVHDFFTAREPFLMTRNTVSSMSPAGAETSLEANDLFDATQGAAGMVLLIELHKAVEVVPRPERGEPVEVRQVNRVAVVPTRPGAVVSEARTRRIG